MKERGDACTYNLNKELQLIYNPACPSKKEITLGNSFKQYVLREGDKIINIRNNYKTFDTDGRRVPIFNGNVGIIKNIDLENRYITVSFQCVGDIIVKSEHLIHIELGYAMTCHKSQGSEFDIVIVGLDMSAYTMLTREWVYTAITRAKKSCFGCFEPYALKLAIERSNVSIKQTFLQEQLQTINESYCNS
jgi:exodeoxyribonuclease V alpha subunit